MPRPVFPANTLITEASLRPQIRTGGTCAACGFAYSAHHGHLEPCPRCAVLRLADATDFLLRSIYPDRVCPAAKLVDEIRTAYPRRV
jgi:hypothetical protein